MAVEVHQFPCLSDNYGFLVHDPVSGETAAIDTPDAAAYLREAAHKGWQITQVWNTHWHEDHAGGNAAIKAATGCTVYAPEEVADKVGGADKVVRDGDMVCLGEWEADVLAVGGHTNGHIAYSFADARIAFVGDTLFALGCGRMFEGTPDQFWHSLSRLKALSPQTLIYCAHEYTASNARFALHADPGNAALASYAAEVFQRREHGQPTVPTPLARELATNPFLRADDPALQALWADRGARVGDPVATFAAIRAAKDKF
ncbi:MAG TPA: hydroxyacylglutathione hydrolase [Novosphingobium sp.]|nr:hydroxyacylglutathione hydrolase [Novosphingobium sp.]